MWASRNGRTSESSNERTFRFIYFRNFAIEGKGNDQRTLILTLTLKAMSHEAICPLQFAMQFLPKKYCRLQLGCQTYATCFATCNEIIFYTPAEYLKMSAAFWLCRIVIGSFSKNCEKSCSGGVTRCNLSRSIVKSRSCFYFLCNLQRNFSLRD